MRKEGAFSPGEISKATFILSYPGRTPPWISNDGQLKIAAPDTRTDEVHGSNNVRNSPDKKPSVKASASPEGYLSLHQNLTGTLYDVPLFSSHC
jgi:hypothetical protein